MMLRTLGTPITVFYIMGEKQKLINGNLVQPQACYCALDHTGKKQNPDRDHQLCYGTGVLPGWDRYGYVSGVFTTTTDNLVLTNSIKSVDDKNRISKFIIGNNSLTGSIETPDYTVNNFLKFTYFKFREVVDLESNRNEYFYSIDSGTTWTKIVIDYTDKANPVVDMSTLPQPGTIVTKIRFRVDQKKKTSASSTPTFIYIKFRYQNKYNLADIDAGFREITIPATLAAYSVNPFVLQQVDAGLMVNQDPNWWVLPEAKIGNGDVVMYLLGHKKGMMYFCSDVEERVYAKFGYPTSITFKTKFVFDKGSDMGIVKYLAEDDELRNNPIFYHSDIESYYPWEKQLSQSHYQSNFPSGGLGSV